ncbi:glycosyltransferase family 61 protein [Methylobacterium sp. WSM2598]|uniref:glycosyltransferase family 61 protein n=1 Tax=Methylobacterium sp. WSM2598 TaxID=398261 RepID=UPI001F27659B|nr:glycosyltransferase family 61 protein [Methylobacterium sp. WSM2598]
MKALGGTRPGARPAIPTKRHLSCVAATRLMTARGMELDPMATSIAGSAWLYKQSLDDPGRIVKLDSSGKILGRDHSLECNWLYVDGRLVFRDFSGHDVAVFPQPLFFDAPRRLTGWSASCADAPRWLLRLDDLVPLQSGSAYDLAAEVREVAHAVAFTCPGPAYGDGGAAPTGYTAGKYNMLTLRDVDLLTTHGAIEKAGVVAEESLFHFPFHLEDRFIRFPDGTFACNAGNPQLSIARARYACAGINENYYHWMMFFVGKICLHGETRASGEGAVVLVPEYRNDVQRRTAELVAKAYGLNLVQLRRCDRVRVDELLLPHQHGSYGIDPHPVVLRAFALIKAAQASAAPGAGRRLYISRADSHYRRLENEREIETLLAGRGFDVVRLADRTLEQQISLLATAEVVVSPHGAGLTNLGYCEPGTKVLEFHSPQYLNWCMRNLSIAAGLRYGFLMGEATEGDRYRVAVAAVDAAVTAMLAA